MKTIDLTCSVCNKIFTRALNKYTYQKKIKGENYHPLCGSKDCKVQFRSKKVSINCSTCGKNIVKLLCEMNAKNNFCNHSCAVKLTNKLRSKIKSTKVINCKRCSASLTIYHSSKTKYCDNCKLHGKSTIKVNLPKIGNCINCSVQIIFKNKIIKYCKACYTKLKPIIFHNMGIKSVQSQCRRSKNEIYFAELCEKNFKNVTNNEQYFQSKYGRWDADVILHDHKVAILWNGIWHYKKVRSNHSPKQTQARDKIKIDIINSHGYAPYIIKDMGRYNKKFVEQQFTIFKEWLTAHLFIGSGI